MTTPPPLPDPAYKTNFGAGLIAYSADQMHDYAAQQVAAERERCAKVCDHLDDDEEFCHMYATGSAECARLIRG